tara:strand:+ start:1104 stop:1973 length:870 start_codon:yes stop_codon:yes gene_type:complete
MASTQASEIRGFSDMFNYILSFFVTPTLSKDIDILCTGKWRENDEKRQKLERLINNEVTILTQHEEGEKQAQCAHALMSLQGLLPTEENEDSDDEELYLYLGAGRGSTQFTITNIDGIVIDSINVETGYPKSGSPNIALLRECVNEININYGKRIKFILGFDSLFHVLKKKCPVVPDSGDLPTDVTTTGSDFSELGYLTDLYSDVPMLVVRNFRMKDGTMRKITFATGTKLLIDLGTGNANLVDPYTGRQIKTIELSNDWMTNDGSLKNIADNIKELMAVAKTYTSTNA